VIARAPVVAITLRALLDRKRTWLMVGLAAIPVLLVSLSVTLSDATIEAEDFDNIILATVLPLIALVFGTSAMGPELEEGTIVYLLTKPVRRVRIVLDKSLVAATLTAALVIPSTLLTGIVASAGGSDVVGTAVAYAVAATLGGAAYTGVFLAASAFTRWALIVGLLYVLLWEGFLADLLPGSNTFSIRQSTLAVARDLAGERVPLDAISLGQGLLVIIAVIVGSVAIATWRLSRYQLRGGD
jgi:ABC-2 type transport system permease protein